MNTLAKVLITIAVVVVGGIAILALSGLYLARHIRVQESGTGDKKTVNIDTPMGAITVHENKGLNPERVGIPIYPGATREDDHGGADFQIDAGNLHKDVTVTGATYYTDDAVDKVRDFYEQKFPDRRGLWKGGDFQIEVRDGLQKRFISIKREGDHTRIGLAAVGAPAAN